MSNQTQPQTQADDRTVIVDPSIMETTEANEETAPAKTRLSGPTKALIALAAIAMMAAVSIGALVIDAQPARAGKLAVPELPDSQPAEDAVSDSQHVGNIAPRMLSCKKCAPDSLVFDHAKGTISCPADCSEYVYDEPAK